MPCFWRPLAPWPIVPAKKMPGHGRALPARRLDRQPALPERRDAELRQVEQRRDEPGRRDDLVDLEREVVAAVGPPEADGRAAPSARRSIRSIAASRIAHAAAEDVVLVRLDVARPDADERLRVDRQLRRRRRDEDELARPRQEPGGELEAGVLLADDEDPPVGVRLGRAGRRRSGWRARCPGAGRRVRLGDADREDERRGSGTRRRSSRATNRSPVGGPRRGGSPSSGSRSGPRRRPAPRTARGSPPSPAATGSTTSRPSARAGSPCGSGSSARRLFQS